MQLKKLTIQAFGPFKDKVIIDFEKDSIDRGLLLITGDTGAGKTTIFDAICYALYGTTSGESRTANSLRSDWASPDVETFVDLEFYYKGRLYEVKRTPEYLRRKKNGTGETKQPATAEININGRIITKVNDVTKEVEKLVGLDYKQFRQVAMLSQGEFTKFLLASSEDKTSIFRKIFGTEFYDKLQYRLKNDLSQKKVEIDRVIEKIETEKKNLEPIINVYGMTNDSVIEVLKEKIKEDEERVLLTKTERDSKNDERLKLNTEITKLKKLNDDIKKYKKAKEDLDNLLLSNQNIKNEKEIYEYNIKVATYIKSLLDLLDKDSNTLKDKKEKSHENQKELDIKKKKYEESKDLFKSLDNFSTNADKLNKNINDLNNKIKDYDNYLNKKRELDIIKEEYKVTTESYEKQNILFEKMRKEYYLNISVEIADHLKDDEECPVCGSTHHPKLATSIDCDFTKEDLEREESKLKLIDSNRIQKEASIEELNKIINEFNFDESKDIELEKEKLNIELSKTKEEKQKLEIEFNKLSSEKQALTSSIKSLEDNNVLFIEDIKKLEDSINISNSKLDKIYVENNTNLEEYNSKKLDRFELEELKQKITSFDKSKEQFESIIRLLEPEVKDKEIVNIEEKEELLNKVNEEYKILDDLFTKSHSTLNKVKDSTNNIEDYYKNSVNIQNEFKIVKVLCDTANGSLTGKQKITFENYVQSYFMNTVLIEANKRLIRMTDNRYELKKKENEVKLNAKTGLDFSVFDSYTGKERDVASLSGGEKFKASLALALGLSDSISNNRGGIKIDSLFIDEGFGSLDPESLNQALNILTDLSGNEKLVGVISHVSELKTRIDNKILINKTNTGSIVSIEANN